MTVSVSRLLNGLRGDGRPVTRDEHLNVHGPLPGRLDRGALIDAVERSELRGRGGAGFPTALKLRAVAGRRGRKVVLANGVEGEPPSGKDKVLLRYAPHLVLDGIELAADTRRCRPGDPRSLAGSTGRTRRVPAALRERGQSGRIEIGLRPFRTDSSPARRPRWSTPSPAAAAAHARPARPFERGIGGRPTLVRTSRRSPNSR